MKNLHGLTAFVLLALALGLACKNPFAAITKQYKCTLAGAAEPKNADEYIERARAHYDREEHSCTVEACAEAIRLDPKNAEAYSCRGLGYYYLGDYDRSIDDQTKAIELQPNYSIYYLRRASAYRRENMPDEALADLDKALNSSHSEREVVLIQSERGDIFLERKDYENAEKAFNAAIEFAPDDKWLYKNRAIAYRELGKTDLANADEQKASDLNITEETQIADAPIQQNSNNSNTPKTISGGVLNGKAVDLPKPAYPAAARAVRASGAVNVQVTVDEKGSVVSASAVSGHPLLRAAATQAARQAKFSPTLLSGKPVKVTGVIVYNFVPE